MTFKAPLSFKPLISRCDVAVLEDGNYVSTTVVVVPTKCVYHDNGFTLKWRCNMSESCQNKCCYYSKAQEKRYG